MMVRKRRGAPLAHDEDPLWYKDAVIYELHVRAFADSDGDGIGDFRGLRSKLDYLQNLGVTALWLLPFYPSPLRDDGYDIADYEDVHPSYGTMHDFRAFMREAHERGLKVITELVINHTSSEHPWFQRARHAPAGSSFRDFYMWSDSPDRYSEARIIFEDYETSNWAWDPVAKAYYWHRFFSHQPDLNYDNPRVHRAVLQSLDFWFGMGIDGLRLDAIPYLYAREGTNCENLPETHVFLKKMRAHIDKKHKGKMLLAEANQWPEDAAEYFGDGDECHMNFHFPVMPRMFMALQMEDRFPIIDILDQTPDIHESCQWALFLRNHDELTLEMVTDEDRDYMYRVYADDPRARVNAGIRRRLAPLVGSRRKVELLNGLLFSLPGTPVLYYGDEIGMGDNIYLGDRDGVRTPMQWSGDRNAGFSAANPQSLYLPVITDPEFHYEAVNVEAQQRNRHSQLWWIKRLIALRQRHRAFGRGSCEFLQPRNRKVLTFLREHEGERILVVANLSRFPQHVELDLARFTGFTPIEMFGQTPFPPIGELPYLLTLGPHAFYWFSLHDAREAEEPSTESAPKTLHVDGNWEELVAGPKSRRLNELLANYLMGRRWFGGKSNAIKRCEIVDSVRLATKPEVTFITMVRVTYHARDAETYVLPLTMVHDSSFEEQHPYAVLARMGEALLVDAFYVRDSIRWLVNNLSRGRSLRGADATVILRGSNALKAADPDKLEPTWPKREQSNTSVLLGEAFVLKLFRRLDEGTNPELEVGRFLADNGATGVAALAGSLEHQRARETPTTLACLQQYIPNEGDAWQYTIDALGRYFERAVTDSRDDLFVPNMSVVSMASLDPPDVAYELIGDYLSTVELLGKRSAELHLKLSSSTNDEAFRPEPFTTLNQRALYQHVRSGLLRSLDKLTDERKRLPAALQSEADWLLAQRDAFNERIRRVLDWKLTATRTRIHGDFHLGQVLFTGSDFVIIDFEGEPAMPISQRRLKRSPVRDVAGMLRSFHYAAGVALDVGPQRLVDRPELLPWANFWYVWVSAAYLRGYLNTAGRADFLPQGGKALDALMDIYLIEKAAYELVYELDNRPDWAHVPLRGLRQILEMGG